MQKERDFNHPGDLLYRPVNALRGLSSLFTVMGNKQLNEVHSEEFGSLIDVVIEVFEQRIGWADEAYQELQKRLDTMEATPKRETFVLEQSRQGVFRRTKVPDGMTLDEFMSTRELQAAE